jgi:hypothetical protein
MEKSKSEQLPKSMGRRTREPQDHYAIPPPSSPQTTAFFRDLSAQNAAKQARISGPQNAAA